MVFVEGMPMSCFAKNLKRIREDAGLTQEQLAQSVNVTRQAISRWERGRTEPDLATLIVLAKILNVGTEELVSGRKNMCYNRFQKKYLVCTIVCFSIVLIVFLLQIIVSPLVKKQVVTSHEGAEAYYLTFQLLLPAIGHISLGILAGAFTALFCKIYLNKPWRKAVLVLGWISVLASMLVILDYVVAILIPGYNPLIITLSFFSIMRSQLMRSLLFVILPIISGVLLFLGFNKEPNGNGSPVAD